MKTFTEGISSLAASFILFTLLALGMVMTYLLSTGQEGRANQVLSTKAFYVTQAGIEYAIKKVYDGESEIVASPGLNFGPGSFTVGRSGRTLTITGTVGQAVQTYAVDSPTEADCTALDVTNLNLHDHDREVSGITFRKICLTQLTIDRMSFGWQPDDGEHLERIRIENSTIYDNPSGVVSGTVIDVADYTTTSNGNQVINDIEWNADMEDKAVTMTFIMGDGSSVSASFTTDD